MQRNDKLIKLLIKLKDDFIDTFSHLEEVNDIARRGSKIIGLDIEVFDQEILLQIKKLEDTNTKFSKEARNVLGETGKRK